MVAHHRHHHVARLVAVLALLSAVGAACSKDSESASTASSAPATDETVPCNGAPLRFTTIYSKTGPLAFLTVAKESEDGTRAAVLAVNKQCALGRPIEVEFCDDKSDPNEATRCGREAAADGSLALFGQSGNFESGPRAAGLPGVLTSGNTPFDLTAPNSFAATSGLTLVVGSVSAAKATGADDIVMVAFDSATTRAFVGQAQEIASSLGASVEPLFIPADTTDFAPVAAQINDDDPEAIGLLVTNPVALVNALADAGISAQDVPIVTGAGQFPPEVIEELGAKADGVYLVSQLTPPSETDNPGIQQMFAELEAAGVSREEAEASSSFLTTAWSQVHILADLLSTLPPEELATLDSAGLVELFASAGPVERPEYATFDFTTPAYPDIPVLASLRLWSREARVLRIEGGRYTSVSPFGDATQPFELDG